jgi:hypothetical protein
MLIFLITIPSMSLLVTQVVMSSEPSDQMIDAVLTVDPEGWITVDVEMIDRTVTATDPFNYTLYGDAKLTDEKATTNITLMIPAENATDIPITSLDTSCLIDLTEGILNTNFTVSLASKEILSQLISDEEILEMIEYVLNSTNFVLDAEYIDGDVNTVIHHTMITNLTDLVSSILNTAIGIEMPLTLNLNYSKGEYNGSIRLVLIPGLPVEDLGIDLTGNLTNTCFNGTIHVTYGDYSTIDPSIGIINKTTLDEFESYAESILNASVDVEGSLMNMTMGRVECTYVNVEREFIDSVGEVVTFEICIGEAVQGEFVFSPFYLLPSEVWEEEELTLDLLWMYFALNNTLYNIQDSEFDLVYTPTDMKLDLNIGGTLHLRDLVEQLLEPISISEEWQTWGLPPEFNSTILPLNWLILETANKTISSIESSNLHMAYYSDDRRAEMNFTLQMNLEELHKNLLELELLLMEYAELPPDIFDTLYTTILENISSIKTSIKYANGEANILVELTLQGDINAEINSLKKEFINLFDQTEPIPWQISYVNDTNLDVTSIECGMKMDNLSTEIIMEGLAIQPPTDKINATAFKLERFFNLSLEEAVLAQGGQLRVTVKGGNNSTHKVTLFANPDVPNPDSVTTDSEGLVTSMSWNQVLLMDLKELQFIIINLPPSAVTLTSPTPTQTTETSITLTWSKNEDPDFLRYEIFQSSTPDNLGTSIANITERETTSYTVTNLSPNTPYHFTIRVVDNIGLSTDSSQIIAKTKTPLWMQSWFIPSIIGITAVAAISILYIKRKQ